MDYQQKIVIVVVVLLLLLAVYFVATQEVPETEGPEESSEAMELLIKGLSFGEGHEDYVYSYVEVSDEYKTEYTLTKNGNESLIEVRNPLSIKKAYYLGNDTILCVEYPPGKESCSSVKHSEALENYMNSLHVKLLDDASIEKNKRDMEYLLAQGYVKLSPEVTEGEGCSEVTYRLDYSNASLADAARFGVQTNAPRVFDFVMCINNGTGYMHEMTFNWTYEGEGHYKTRTLVSFKSYSSPITAPEELDGNAMARLENEREQYVKLVECYTDMEGEDRNRCIATIALDTHRTDLCELAGERRDRCLVSIVPLTKDVGICPAINDPSFRDDCYIELAGAYKNSTYCDEIQNASKMDFCLDVAAPEPEANETAGNETEMDILDFLEYVDDADSMDGNATNQTAGNETNATKDE